jgi:pilus assembly protein Flp/PilA
LQEKPAHQLTQLQLRTGTFAARFGKIAQDWSPDQLRQLSVDHKELMMKYLVSRFLKDQSGATAIEYGLIAAGIAVAIIAVVNGLGTKLKDTFQAVTTNMHQ